MTAYPARTAYPRNAAIKDNSLAYQTCTLGYARALLLQSPTLMIGQTDFDFLPHASAELIRNTDLRVLRTGTPEITAGSLLSKRLAGCYFVRSPLSNPDGQITGIEIHALKLSELHQSYRMLLERNLQFHELVDRATFGLLIHNNFKPLYQNVQWAALTGNRFKAAFGEELRMLIEADASDSELAPNSGGTGFMSFPVHWNGIQAAAVLCLPGVNSPNDSAAQLTRANPFVEKRVGPRGDGSRGIRPSPQPAEVALFDSVRHPVLVCDGWSLLDANDSGRKLLAAQAARNNPLESWFSDRKKVEVEVMLSERASTPVEASLLFDTDIYVVSFSVITWAGRLAVCISLLEDSIHRTEINRLQGRLNKLEDFANAGSDFLWETDSDLNLVRLSVEMQPLLGANNQELIGSPLTKVFDRFGLADDAAEWSLLSIDLRDHQPIRDREIKWQHKEGGVRVVRLSAIPVFDGSEFAGYRGSGRDVTDAYEAAREVAFHASHDALTGLVNRREFELQCDEAVRTARDDKVTHALCFLDLDNFKTVNDTSGHPAGDELLRQLSDLFAGLVRKSDVLARLGGDEFGVLIFDVGINEALRLANQLRSEVESFQFLWEDKRFTVGVSIGVVIIDDRWENRSAVFSAADSACYESKNKGRNRVAVYQETGSDQRSGERQQWVQLINSAIDKKRIQLSMQKIQPLDSSDQGLYSELFVRLQNSEGEELSPRAFLPAAERYGLCPRLDLAVVDTAIDWLAGQPHIADSMTMCAINLSGQSIVDEDFTRLLIDTLNTAAVDVSSLCFELRETAVVSNLSAATSFIKRVRETGCHFTIDNFGSGLSSFAYLRHLPITYLKIDGLLVSDILDDAVDFAMVKSISEIGKTLGKKIIAEHVESDSILDRLHDLEVDYAQGYHIGRPQLIDY